MTNNPSHFYGSGSDESAEVSSIQGGRRTQSPIGVTQIPYGYEVWADGVYRWISKKQDDDEEAAERLCEEVATLDKTPSTWRRSRLHQLSTLPMWVSSLAKRLDTGEELVEVSTIDLQSGEVVQVWVTRADVLNRRKLETLAKYGLPVRSQKAAELEDYFDRSLALNRERIPWQHMAARLGQYEIPDKYGRSVGTGFLLSDRWIGPEGTHVSLDEREASRFNKRMLQSGNPDAWLAKFHEICDKNKLARWLTHMAFASPVLDLVRNRTFIIHHWGKTSGGKTALAQFAMSAWGDPQDLKATFNATEIGMIEMFKYINNLPLLFDELQASRNKDQSTMIYNICNETGRIRGGQRGGLEATIDGWKSVVRTTGEESIIGEVDLGGQTNRVLQINEQGLTSEEAGALHEWFAEGHHGWGGVLFLQRLVQIANREDARERLQRIRDEFVDHFKSSHPALGARGRHFALAAVVQYLVYRAPAFYGLDEDDAKERALLDGRFVAGKVLEGDADTASPGEDALAFFQQTVMSDSRMWLDPMNANDLDTMSSGKHAGKLLGVLMEAKNEVWLSPNVAKRLITQEGWPIQRVLSDWTKNNVIQRTKDRRTTLARSYGKLKGRWYVLDYEKFFAGTEEE